MQLVEAGLRAIGLSEQSLHFSCIPAMHLPPPRTALAHEPHATAPVPGPHDAHDAARAAYAGGLYAYVPGMHKQVCSGTPDGVTATAPAETADRTRTAPAHPSESRITSAAEERLMRIAKTPPRTRRPHTSSPHDYLAVHRAPQMTKFLSAIAYRMRLWLRSPNPMWQGVSQRSNDLTILLVSRNLAPPAL